VLNEYFTSIQAARDEMADFLAELVLVPTENPPGRDYEAGLTVVAEGLSRLGLHAAIEAVPGGDEDPKHPRLWLRSSIGGHGADADDDRKSTVVFHGHVDVVPAQEASQFEPTVTEDAVFGRGSTDMKGGIVSMIYAMKLLKESAQKLPGRVELRIVPDEETGGRLGSAALLKSGRLVGPNDVAMFTAEPTGGVVWHASRGAISCRIEVKGRSSHVGLAYRGTNAFEKALIVADKLRALESKVAERRTQFAIEPADARRSILLMGGEVEGTANFNVVPDRFMFTVDRRINPEEDFDEEKRALLGALESASAKDVDMVVDVFQQARPAAVPRDHPIALALSGAIASVTGTMASFELCPGILEIRFYAEKGIPAFAYGPGLLSVAHGPKEFVKRKDMEQCAIVYALAAESVLEARKPSPK
jgi:acetylornithine deacetylase/succinyl-diaminopimelate desuccinylase family protein